MRLRFLIPVLPVVVLSATAASIETSATCQAGPRTNTGTTGCGASFHDSLESYGEATASAGANDELRGYGYMYGFSVSTSAFASARNLDASASSESSVTQWYTTEGPVRDGWIDLFIRGDGEGIGGGSGGAGGWVGPYYGGSYRPSVRGRFPFPLGVPFLLTLSSGSSGRSSGYDSYAIGGWGVVDVYFTVWEADLWEPVFPREYSSVPEPAGTAVIGILLMSLRLLRSKRRK